MSNPEFLSSINARTALETPQVHIEWEYTSEESPITTGVPWVWEQAILRSSNYRYPEAITEGNSVLSEVYSTSPTTGIGDTNVDDMKSYYYNLFLKYREHDSSVVGYDQDISRLGSSFRGCGKDIPELKGSATDGSSSATSPIFNTVADFFYDNSVQAGDILQIDEGAADDGFYTILSVNSNKQVTLDSNLTLTASNVDFHVYSKFERFWITSISPEGPRKIWRWNATTQMADMDVNIESVLANGEVLLSVQATTISSTDYLLVLTSRRYLKFAYPTSVETILTSSDIVTSYTHLNRLSSGFQASGFFETGGSIYILDSTNLEIKVYPDSTGVVSSTYDISGLPTVSTYSPIGICYDSGLSYIFVGLHNYVLAFPLAQTTPTTVHVERTIYLRDVLDTDIACYTTFLTSEQYIGVVESEDLKLLSYTVEVGREYLWQQPYTPDTNTAALYHLNDDGSSVLDAGPGANHGTNSGMTVEQTAKFDLGYTATAIANNVDISAMSGDFDGAEGSISLWFKATTASDLTGATSRYITVLEVDANNRIYIGIESNNLIFSYEAGGTVKSVSATHPSADTNWHHYLLSWSATADEVKAYVDGSQFGTTQTSLGTWAGVLATAVIGGDSSNTLLGTYDEVFVTKSLVRNIRDGVFSYSENKAHAFSGRTYTTAYKDGSPLNYYYRDEFFTNKFMGGEHIIKNDYESTQLHPPNKVLSDGEIINRGPDPLPSLGHTGRITRLWGLYLDRMADYREALMQRYKFNLCDVDFFSSIADSLGIPGLDTDTWNVDKQRQYIKLMPDVLDRGGVLQSYILYAKLLGFELLENTLVARRRWDSVLHSAVDPGTEPIYLDEMGSMDTGDETHPLAFLRFKFFQKVSSGTTGVTSIPATREFDDLSATFKSTVNEGSMLKIYDIDTTGDNGKYTVVRVVSDTKLLLDQDFPTGSLSSLNYTINELVPEADPWMDFLLKRFEDIAPDSMSLVYYP